ncbi:MAG: beta-ketoacyl-ACP synthase III [Gammaproteobacteria bacterium]|nr:beta-ketoacyl-ACP synthase III [Gammaproteobacteria bacterium]
MSNIHIAGTGIWYPEDKVTNEEIVTSFNAYVDNFNIENASVISKGHLEPMEHSSVDFIEQASGIQTRYVIDKEGILNPEKMMPSLQNEDESLISLHAQKGLIAAKKAIEQAEISVNDIDAVIVGSSHAARNYPAVAIEIQHELGINGYAYDMLVGCSSTTFAINNAFSDIASGLANTILVVNPEISTPACNFAERDKHFIFGDACAATIVQKDSKSKKSFKILDRKLHTQFSNNIRSDFSYLNRTAINQKTGDELLFRQNGRSVFKDVCPLVASLIKDQLEANSINQEDISKFWLHQANGKMIRLIASKVIGTDDFDTERVPMPIVKFGNLASVGSLFAFNLNNDMKTGEKGVICSFGAGYSVCSIIVEKA